MAKRQKQPFKSKSFSDSVEAALDFIDKKRDKKVPAFLTHRLSNTVYQRKLGFIVSTDVEWIVNYQERAA